MFCYCHIIFLNNLSFFREGGNIRQLWITTCVSVSFDGPHRVIVASKASSLVRNWTTSS
ncbi:hypothetical protein AtNW77_Chr1g0020991 [Arabidopsis thaliana]|uniref:Uncharacterized protein n=4 Tax=Arabidopsis TaxID=3701 RepID=A0A654EB00_ARATH|nr:uncharacterized protein AT1G18871 [Arabidopsis thaliana]KAG7646814.1 hypothetical protein ISN45_At01g019110 [Arabidopsis thaliana x Arabidopsis arenosa]KAG7654792.1 hypothetical protein ISN44_As01g019280 [Arabidopsis suecica]AEE29775.1 hypothetical protein AT1G18871 [Arabidopsis thaliana]CAA0219891.1 unnamed protein product [Arabidopsis thaliana]VYS46523.1 unnamed protein product [Arabidopsis thaliana]|eukprot:NP_001117309.1 hypothetical protein AT1G18871 [Arabidopsis thaliana]